MKEGGEAATGRLHLFLSSVFSSIFGQTENLQEDPEEHSMASKSHHQQQIPTSRKETHFSNSWIILIRLELPGIF